MIFQSLGLSFIVPALMFHIGRASATTQTLYKKFGTDSVLKGYVIERSTVSTLVECCLKCAELLPQCKSLNYVKNLNETAICEINNSSKILAKEEDFLGQPRSQYFEAIAVTNKNQDISQEVSTTNSYTDGRWTLVARFSNNDSKNWMEDQGTWWYDKVEPYGKPLDPGDNADMISEAFWLLNGIEFKITRSDDSTHTALLTTTGNCLGGKTFRSKMASFGTFRGTTSWASDKCLGSCSVTYGGFYTTTEGFGQSQCNGNIQSKNSIEFWCDYDSDGSVLMIGGGGSNCARADHGIGITEENTARFYTTTKEYDFGNSANGTPTKSYSLNLWVHKEIRIRLLFYLY